MKNVMLIAAATTFFVSLGGYLDSQDNAQQRQELPFEMGKKEVQIDGTSVSAKIERNDEGVFVVITVKNDGGEEQKVKLNVRGFSMNVNAMSRSPMPTSFEKVFESAIEVKVAPKSEATKKITLEEAKKGVKAPDVSVEAAEIDAFGKFYALNDYKIAGENLVAFTARELKLIEKKKPVVVETK